MPPSSVPSRRGLPGQGLPRDVIVLGVIAFCVAVGFGVLVPVLPIFARSFEVDNLMVGAVISAFAFMRLVTSPWCARFNRWLGERAALGIGMFIVAASSAAAGLSQSFWQLLVMRGVGGIGSAMFTVAAMTLLLRAVTPEQRGRASAFYSGGFLIGGMAGPAVGGLFAAISITAPFFFYAATLMVAGVVGLTMLGRTDAGPLQDSRPVMELSEALPDVRYRAALLTNFAQGWQTFGVRSSLVPVLVVESLHQQPSTTGVLFAIAAVVQTIALGPSGRIVDTLGRRPVMVAAGLVTGAAALAMPWAGNVWLLGAVLCLYGLGSAMHSTAPTAVVGDVTGGRAGTPIAVFQMMSDVGAIIGPLAAGALADRGGMASAFTVGAVFLLAGAALSWNMPKETNREATV